LAEEKKERRKEGRERETFEKIRGLIVVALVVGREKKKSSFFGNKFSQHEKGLQFDNQK
jgi:hypothetical protein